MDFGSNTPLLETKRLILRKFTADDCEDLFRILSDERVNVFLPWFPHKSPEETRAFLERSVFADYRKKIAYRYAIEMRGENRVIGYLSLLGIDEERRGGDIGYGLLRAYWGRGIMTEAVGALLARLRADGFRYATATHDVNNPASGRVMQKSGMRYVCTYPEFWQPKGIQTQFKLYRIDLQD